MLDKFLPHLCLKMTHMIWDVLTQIDALTRDAPLGQLEYGTNDSSKGKKVIIKYSAPNTAKSFQVGHLRRTIIGAFLENLYKTCGREHLFYIYITINKDAASDHTVNASASSWFKRMEDEDEDALKN
ncbi:hypothetical protein CVT25_006793 [Psilocybe cyanescens]|uniref:Arginyl-tRNA synthetase catalytic core domain-containing protein n=1 Tax=Psilocybe cyanescens TaxID=93625 RepID=A0A409WYI4_PSICY|nr:hypothetical protein CVT25_006793 [Psilocybe cyanescens]